MNSEQVTVESLLKLFPVGPLPIPDAVERLKENRFYGVGLLKTLVFQGNNPRSRETDWSRYLIAWVGLPVVANDETYVDDKFDATDQFRVMATRGKRGLRVKLLSGDLLYRYSLRPEKINPFDILKISNIEPFTNAIFVVSQFALNCRNHNYCVDPDPLVITPQDAHSVRVLHLNPLLTELQHLASQSGVWQFIGDGNQP